MAQIGIETIICPSAFDEVSGKPQAAAEVVLFNAEGKCRSVATEKGDEIPVLAADTIVVLEEQILGKPKNAEDAQVMLRTLSGRTHRVMTGVAIALRGKLLSKVCSTEVVFRSLTEQEILDYVATGEPLDKAGAYGIQGAGAILVDHICGDYNNVVGLPLTETYLMLKELSE